MTKEKEKFFYYVKYYDESFGPFTTEVEMFDHIALKNSEVDLVECDFYKAVQLTYEPPKEIYGVLVDEDGVSEDAV